MQLALALKDPKSWGGKRDGAGRPRGKRVSHDAREPHNWRHPVHLTLRVVPEAGCLRAKKPFKAIRDAIRDANREGKLRIVHYSVQGNHLHLIVEAVKGVPLSRGIQGLNIRIARAINGLLHRRGAVFADRYHRHDLATPAETKNAIRYVANNYRKHNAARIELPRGWVDPCSSATHDDTVVAAKTWLLSIGHRIHAGPNA